MSAPVRVRAEGGSADAADRHARGVVALALLGAHTSAVAWPAAAVQPATCTAGSAGTGTGAGAGLAVPVGGRIGSRRLGATHRNRAPGSGGAASRRVGPHRCRCGSRCARDRHTCWQRRSRRRRTGGRCCRSGRSRWRSRRWPGAGVAADPIGPGDAGTGSPTTGGPAGAAPAGPGGAVPGVGGPLGGGPAGGGGGGGGAPAAAQPAGSGGVPAGVVPGSGGPVGSGSGRWCPGRRW